MIADFPSSILIPLPVLSTGTRFAKSLCGRVSMPIYSPKRGFGTMPLVKTLRKRDGSISRAWPAAP